MACMSYRKACQAPSMLPLGAQFSFKYLQLQMLIRIARWDVGSQNIGFSRTVFKLNSRSRRPYQLAPTEDAWNHARHFTYYSYNDRLLPKCITAAANDGGWQDGKSAEFWWISQATVGDFKVKKYLGRSVGSASQLIGWATVDVFYRACNQLLKLMPLNFCDCWVGLKFRLRAASSLQYNVNPKSNTELQTNIMYHTHTFESFKCINQQDVLVLCPPYMILVSAQILPTNYRNHE